ncbi:MAG: hypothetical protein NTY86_11295 [Deltaproteobacteria bacterium]|nr:hypothetical protein [Deltaproteobacteria bacterium]
MADLFLRMKAIFYAKTAPVSKFFDKNFLFRVGSVGKAPLYVNDEFGRKWPQDAIILLTLFRMGNVAASAKGILSVLRFVLTSGLFCNSVTAKPYTKV